jgi:hypothetical protein
MPRIPPRVRRCIKYVCIASLNLSRRLMLFSCSAAPIGDCSIVRKLAFIYTVAVPSTLLLFVFRVCALYHNRKYAVVFFSCLWIGLLACSIVMPFGTSAYKVPFTNYCIETKTGFAYTVIDLSPLIHDTIIFLATSWAFIYHSSAYQDMTLKNGLRVLLFGKFLPAFSKTILRDGQLYYLWVIFLFLFSATDSYETNHYTFLGPFSFLISS